jgi:O-antigen/teichoic acid export membrane protein
MVTLNKIARGMVWNSVGRSLFFLITLLLSVVLARLLAPHAYGTYILLMAIASSLMLFTFLGIENSINRFVPPLAAENKYSKIAYLMKRVTLARACTVILVSLSLFFGSGFLANSLFDNPSLEFYVKILAVLVFPLGFQGMLGAFLNSLYEQKFLNITNVTIELLNLLIVFFILTAGYGLTGVLASVVFTRFLLLFILYRKSIKIFADFLGHFRTAAFDLGRIMRYAWIIFLYEIFDYLFGRDLDVLILGRYHIPSEIAFYSIAYNLVFLSLHIFLRMFEGGLAIIIVSELFEKRDFNGLKKAYSMLFQITYFITIPIAIGGVILGGSIISLLYGTEYLDSTPIASLYFFTMTILLLKGFSATFLGGMNEESKLLRAALIFGTTNLILDLILIPKYAAIGAAIATSTAWILGASYETYILHKVLHPEYPIKFLLKTILASSIMGVIVFMLKDILGLNVIFLVILGFSIYLAAVKLLKPVSKESLALIEESKMPFGKVLLRLLR